MTIRELKSLIKEEYDNDEIGHAMYMAIDKLKDALKHNNHIEDWAMKYPISAKKLLPIIDRLSELLYKTK